MKFKLKLTFYTSRLSAVPAAFAVGREWTPRPWPSPAAPAWQPSGTLQLASALPTCPPSTRGWSTASPQRWAAVTGVLSAVSARQRRHPLRHPRPRRPLPHRPRHRPRHHPRRYPPSAHPSATRILLRAFSTCGSGGFRVRIRSTGMHTTGQRCIRPRQQHPQSGLPVA